MKDSEAEIVRAALLPKLRKKFREERMKFIKVSMPERLFGRDIKEALRLWSLWGIAFLMLAIAFFNGYTQAHGKNPTPWWYWAMMVFWAAFVSFMGHLNSYNAGRAVGRQIVIEIMEAATDSMVTANDMITVFTSDNHEALIKLQDRHEITNEEMDAATSLVQVAKKQLAEEDAADGSATPAS